MDYLQKIKELISFKKITQKELSEKINKSENTLSNYFKGNTKIDVDTLIDIAKAFGVSPAIFFKDEELYQEMFFIDVADEQLEMIRSKYEKRDNYLKNITFSEFLKMYQISAIENINSNYVKSKDYSNIHGSGNNVNINSKNAKILSAEKLKELELCKAELAGLKEQIKLLKELNEVYKNPKK